MFWLLLVRNVHFWYECITRHFSHRGLGIERILISLITTYNDPGNLVVVMGTNHREEEYLLAQLEAQSLTPLPRCITADCPVNERLVYLTCLLICLSIDSCMYVPCLLAEKVNGI